MKRSIFILLIVLTIFMSNSITFATTITIDAKSNIFGAGHLTPPNPGGGGGGILPPLYSFTPGPDQILSFSSITGMVSYNGGGNYYGPDGLLGYGEGTDIFSYGGISGINHSNHPNNRIMFLVGVFLNDLEPSDPAPPRLNFGTNGLTDSFTELYLELNQTFFVGDGLTGTGSGSIQTFYVPETATRLFLGFSDGYDFEGYPGLFNDNIGTLTATFEISTRPTSVPDAPIMILLGSSLMGLAVFSRNSKKS